MKMIKFLILFLTFYFTASCSQKKSDLIIHYNKQDIINTPDVKEQESPDVGLGGQVLRISDRFYISGLLKDIFGSSADSATGAFIKTRMDYFGGGCDQYELNLDNSGTCLNDDCELSKCSGTTIINNQIGVSSAIRKGWIIRACEEIADHDTAILSAVQSLFDPTPVLTTTTVPAPTTATLTKAYQLFYRSIPPNDTVVSALVNVAASETTSNFEKWRYVFLSICTTSEWQIP